MIVGSIGFIFLWLVTLTSNTHNFYFVSAVEDLRREELAAAQEGLRLLPERAKLAASTAKARLKSDVEAKIAKMKSEIMNSGDPGSGLKTERIIIEIEDILQSKVQRLTLPSESLIGLTRYAGQMADQMRSILEVRFAEIDKAAASVDEYLKKPEFMHVSARLKNALDKGAESLRENELKDLLRTAFSLYNEGLAFVGQAYSAPRLKELFSNFSTLPKVPRSISLENVAEAWRDFLAGQFEPWKFWLALLWAFSLDVATFVLFYFGVLPRDDD